MFTAEQRDRVRDRVLELARSDPRVTAGALTGSTAAGAQDRWSDLDLAFALADGAAPAALLDDWTEAFEREFGVLHHWDLPAGAAIFRVFLLSGGLELDVATMPHAAFGA